MRSASSETRPPRNAVVIASRRCKAELQGGGVGGIRTIRSCFSEGVGRGARIPARRDLRYGKRRRPILSERAREQVAPTATPAVLERNFPLETARPRPAHLRF
jgi:hypothetical protein